MIASKSNNICGKTHN